MTLAERYLVLRNVPIQKFNSRIIYRKQSIMSDIKMEGQDPVAAAPVVKTEPEVAAVAESIKQEPTTVVEPEIKDEKMDDVEVQTEVKEEKVEAANGNVKSEEADEKKDKKFDPNEPRFYDNGVLKTNRNEIWGKNNSKYDASVLPKSEDAGLIRGQVEFYFGDSNLPTDAFLMKVTGGAENKPVPIATIHSFKRMQRFQPYSLVVDALKQSNFLVVEGEEGKETVKRKKPFDPSARSPRAKTEARSVYIKGFGDEEPSSQFDIEAFVAPYGVVNSVRLRRTEEKLFKGSVFVEFGDEETAQKFLALDPKPQWKGKHVLDIKSKTQYMEEKNEEIRNGTLRERDGDGDRDPNDWKKRRENDRENGFKNGRGRGGRGRGDRRNNDRNGGRNDRGPRNNDHNKERNEKDGDDKEVKVEKSADSAAEAPVNEKKRAREDDGAVEEHQNKKVDVKQEVTAEA
ncbi:hypothetical protein DID88_000339 [Monilinia fructigena]|uniref:HTH La-type RNA-binding domain-containing protein n=1 Tax=Monilinia fructigena TaxID=38457 RepID=A0A395IH84_9HELO|nr:hypothetical protein DID88_000339 [Monilinia fructigena]